MSSSSFSSNTRMKRRENKISYFNRENVNCETNGEMLRVFVMYFREHVANNSEIRKNETRRGVDLATLEKTRLNV